MHRRHGSWLVAVGLVGAWYGTLVTGAGPVTLSNMATDSDGRYWVTVDDYGAVDGWGSNYGADALNAVGALPARAITFVSAFYLFVTNTHRELLADNVSWQTLEQT